MLKVENARAVYRRSGPALGASGASGFAGIVKDAGTAKDAGFAGTGGAAGKDRRDVTVFSGLDLEIPPGETVTLIGPSGCGKSTLLAAIAGLKSLDEGSVELAGRRVEAGDRRIGMVLQHYGLFPWLTVEKNASLGLRIRKKPPGEIASVLEGLFLRLGLTGLEDRYPRELSGGQQQRVALARTFALEPEVLLLDEPFSALDAMTREGLQDLLLELLRGGWGAAGGEGGKITLLVTHSVEEAVFLGRRILVMDPREGRGFFAGLENPGSGESAYRKDSAFFERVRELRGILESMAALA